MIPLQSPAPKTNLFLTRPAAAFVAAAKARRPVFAVVSASWCGPCKALREELGREPYQAILARNYIVLWLEIDDKNPAVARRAREIKSASPGRDRGIPYPLVLDAKGRFVADGGPASPGGEGLMRLFYTTIPKDRRTAELTPLRRYLDRG